MDFLIAIAAALIFVLLPFACIGVAFFSLLGMDQLWHESTELGHWLRDHRPRVAHHG